MAAVKLLVIAGRADGELLSRAAAALGGTVVRLEADRRLIGRVAAANAEAVIVASGPGVRDASAIVRRLRAGPGRDLPMVFLGGADEVEVVEPIVQAVFVRPAALEAVAARAIALALGGSSAAPASEGVPAPDGPALTQLGASVDGALESEMLKAVRTVTKVGAEQPPDMMQPRAETPEQALDEIWVDLLETEEAPRPLQTGSFTDVDAPLLFGRAFAEGLTAKLVVTSDGVEKTIHFEAGRPVHAASNRAEDRLIEMLLRAGRLSSAQHQAAMNARADGGRKMGAVLLDLGFVKTTELLPLVRWHYEEIVLSVFSWTTGQWRLEAGTLVPPERLRLLRHPAVLVREGLRRGYPADRVWTRLGSQRNVFRFTPGADDPIEAAADRQVLSLFDGVRPFAEVVRESELGEQVLAEVAFTAWVLGQLRPAQTEGDVDDTNAEVDVARVRARYALALDGDYFRFLGVGRDASGQEIHRAYERLVAEVAPDRVSLGVARSASKELETVREVLAEALRVIGSESLRERYLSGLR